MDNKQVLGVFDSGLGGLTVVAEIKKLYPKSSIVYLGDTARVPYGTRSKEVVEEFAVQDARFLESFGVDIIIIACNTASALATDAVRKAVSVPVYEVITTAKAKAEEISTKIGVIGTRGTINSGAYGHLGVACPLLVPFIEEGELESEALTLILKKYLQPLIEAKIDTLILGCTHYPIIADLIQEIMGSNIRLINPGEELARTLNLPDSEGKDEYYVTDLTSRYAETAKRFLGKIIEPRLVKLN